MSYPARKVSAVTAVVAVVSLFIGAILFVVAVSEISGRYVFVCLGLVMVAIAGALAIVAFSVSFRLVCSISGNRIHAILRDAAGITVFAGEIISTYVLYLHDERVGPDLVLVLTRNGIWVCPASEYSLND